MKVEYNTGTFVNRGKVIATVVMRERSSFSYELEPPQICFVIELPNGIITYEPIKNCRIVPNIFKRLVNYVRRTLHRRPSTRRQR
jgi:hypothetical protein